MHFLLLLLLQVGIIVVAARLCGLAFRRLRQPQVVGEMAAGILLGPSFLGWIAPGLSATIFPPESLPHINTLSQIGLLLFMFLVGLEFDPKLIKGRGHAAVVTSHVSIIAPFFLGSVLALYLYPRLSDDSVPFHGFALFMGAAMSVTAFPVLARILVERNLLRTKVGTVTIACAAVDDVTAWSILAVVIALVRADALELPLWMTLVGTAAFVTILVMVVRPALGWLERRYHNRGRLTQDMLGLLLLLLLASAWTTEWLGIHALFGAFLIGAVMPKDKGFVHEVTSKLEDVTVVFLLPLFFASAGLRTSIGLVSGAEMWGFFGLIMLVAVAGKFGGSSLSARFCGLSWPESGALGILMNTRGLMELVILTIGLDLGVISPALFTMMVLMALTTTAMTTPILEWLYPPSELRASMIEDAEPDEFSVVVPVALPASGPGLLRMARSLVPVGCTPRVYGLHLRPSSTELVTDLDGGDAPGDEASLRPLLEAAVEQGTEVRPLVFASHKPARDIVDVARVKGARLVLMGWHKPVVAQAILGGTVAQVISSATCDVAVYVERRTDPCKQILVPCRNITEDGPVVEAAGRVAASTGAKLTLLRVIDPRESVLESLDDFLRQLPPSLTHASVQPKVDVQVVRHLDPLAAVVEEARRGAYDLIVVGAAKAWELDATFQPRRWVSSVFGLRHQRLMRKTGASLLVYHGHGQAASSTSFETAAKVSKAPADPAAA